MSKLIAAPVVKASALRCIASPVVKAPASISNMWLVVLAASINKAFWSTSSLSINNAALPEAEPFSISTPPPSVPAESNFTNPSILKVKSAAWLSSSIVDIVVAPAAEVAIVNLSPESALLLILKSVLPSWLMLFSVQQAEQNPQHYL
jgi:hypothetical protein